MVSLSVEALEFFRRHGKRGGKAGAKARMEKLTPEQRSEAARNGGKNRWKAKNAKKA